jgi:RimJ/RimL family protein N-acetyltransferase
MRGAAPVTAFRRTCFETDRFRIRPAGPHDQGLMFAWRSDAATAHYLSGAPPASLAAQQAWFARAAADPLRAYHLIEDRLAGDEALGFTSLVSFDADEPEAEWGVVMGRRRGQGVVRLLAPLICRCALELSGLRRLYACVNPGNEPAMRKMTTLGAVIIEGPHRYRKAGEILYEIAADRLAQTVAARAATEPDLAMALQVRARSVPDTSAG